MYSDKVSTPRLQNLAMYSIWAKVRSISSLNSGQTLVSYSSAKLRATRRSENQLLVVESSPLMGKQLEVPQLKQKAWKVDHIVADQVQLSESGEALQSAREVLESVE